MLVPFNTDLRSSGADISFRITSNPDDIKLIDDAIMLSLNQPGYPASYKTQEAIIITNNHIAYYANAEQKFHFQTVLATDFTHAFVYVSFDRLERQGEDNIGFHQPGIGTKNFGLTADGTLVNNSNIGIPGRYVFLLEC